MARKIPFEDMLVTEQNISATFADLDNDGDLDSFIGSVYHENLMYSKFFVDEQRFIERHEEENPLSHYTPDAPYGNVYSQPAPFLIDF